MFYSKDKRVLFTKLNRIKDVLSIRRYLAHAKIKIKKIKDKTLSVLKGNIINEIKF